MIVTEMRLQRFKNFRDAQLRLGPLTVLVGTNASGKSNLRDAFRFVHGMSRGYTLAEIIGEKYGEGGFLQWKGIRGGTREVAYAGEGTFVVETHLTAGPPQRIYPDQLRHPISLPRWVHRIEVEIDGGARPPRVVAESLWLRSAARREKMIYDSHPAEDLPAQEGQQYLFVRLARGGRNRKIGKRLRFVSNQPVLSQFAEHRDPTDSMRNAATFVQKRLASLRFLDLSPDAMKLPSLPGQIILGDRGENLSSVLQAICQDGASKRAIARWISELTPLDVVDFEFVPDQTGRILVTLVESNGQKTSAYSASDGTLRFLAMIAAVLGPDAAKFYFLEEIDNGIHPTRLHLLLQLIEQNASEGKVQVVATSHSPQFLAMLSQSALEYAALVYRLGDTPDARIRSILGIPEARRVLKQQNLARLQESGWLENAVAFSDEEHAEAEAKP